MMRLGTLTFGFFIMDQFENQTGEFQYCGKLGTRMACHMGDNKASALCNILGDQPLFYIDYVDADESDFLDPLDMGEEMFIAEDLSKMIPEGYEHLRRRMERLEGASSHIDNYSKAPVLAAFDLAVNQLSHDHAEVSAEEIVDFLSSSRFALQMYADTVKTGLHIVTSYEIDTASYDRESKTLRVNPRLPIDFAALATARALRQAWLHQNGAAIHPLHFAPEEAVLLNRIQQADLTGTVLRTAWEFKLAGKSDAWARLLTGSAYDLALSFAREAIADFRALNNGAAANAVFEKWFFSGRCKDVDRRLIQSMLADQHGLVFDHPHVSKVVTADVIARTGDQPLGKNYLTGLVEIILADPLFTEVRDRSNANFLWFIKFERSFRASEEGIMPVEATPLPGVPAAPAASHTAEDRTSVVSFPAKALVKTARKRKGVADAAESGRATIYYLDHFLTLSNR